MTVLDNGEIKCEGNPTDSSQSLVYWITSTAISYPYSIRLEGLPDNRDFCFGGSNIGKAYNGKIIAANTSISLAIMIDGTVQTDGMILTPMVIPNYIADNTFEPPSKDNITITKDITHLVAEKLCYYQTEIGQNQSIDINLTALKVRGASCIVLFAFHPYNSTDYGIYITAGGYTTTSITIHQFTGLSFSKTGNNIINFTSTTNGAFITMYYVGIY